MSFNTSYIVNQELKVKDQELSKKIDRLLLFQEQIALANGFDIVDTYQLTREYKSINGLKVLYPMQELIGATAKDYSDNTSNGTYTNVLFGIEGFNDMVPKMIRYNNRGYLDADISSSVKGLSSYTTTFIVNLDSKLQSQNLWFEPTADAMNKARFQVIWNIDFDKCLTVAVRTGLGSQASQLIKTDILDNGIYIFHVTVDIANDQVKIFKNGVEVGVNGTVEFESQAVENTAPIANPRFGALLSNLGGYFDSKAAFFALYNRALTNAEILKQATVAGLVNSQ